MSRVGLYDRKIAESNSKIKDLLLRQNQQFFELNQRLGEKLIGTESKISKGAESSIRVRSDSGGFGVCSQL